MNRIFFLIIIAFALTSTSSNAKDDESSELTISGFVETPLKLDIAQLKKMDNKTLVLDPKTCFIGKEKSKDVLALATYRGVLLKDILEKSVLLVKDHNDIKKMFVVARATDGYTVVFSWGELFISKVGDNVMVAIEKDGKLLPPTEGKIALVSVSDTRNSRHIRWLNSIEVKKL